MGDLLTTREAAELGDLTDRERRALARTQRYDVRFPDGDAVTLPAITLHPAWRRKLDAATAPVYFLTAGPFVKIGFSRDIDNRIRQLQPGCPYPISLRFKTFSGGDCLERFLHNRYKAHRAAGEWFSGFHDWEADARLVIRALRIDVEEGT